jgi:hypothetical protein
MSEREKYNYFVETCGLRFGPFHDLQGVFCWARDREASIYDTSTDVCPGLPPSFTVCALRIPRGHQ